MDLACLLGSGDTSRIRTRAEKVDGGWTVNGQKVWISNAQNADKILLPARTSGRNEDKPLDGMTLFFTDLNRDRITVREIEKLGRSAIDSNELFIENLEVGDDEVVGQVGQGFRYLIDGLNSERIVVGLEGVGIGQAALELATKYANQRVVFDRPIGQNQAVAHPLADSWIRLESARLMAMHAAELYDDHQNCGVQAAAAPSIWAPRPASMPATGPCPRTVAMPTPRSTTWSGCGGRPGCSATRLSRRRWSSTTFRRRR